MQILKVSDKKKKDAAVAIVWCDANLTQPILWPSLSGNIKHHALGIKTNKRTNNNNNNNHDDNDADYARNRPIISVSSVNITPKLGQSNQQAKIQSYFSHKLTRVMTGRIRIFLHPSFFPHDKFTANKRA